MTVTMDWQSMFSMLNNRAVEPVSAPTTCSHSDVIEEENYNVCAECGAIVGQKLCVESCFSDTMTFRRKQVHCTVYADISPEFDSSVRHLAVTIYKAVTDKKIYRCSQRRAIIAACVHRASVLLGAPDSNCFKVFNLTKAEINRGVGFVAANLAHDEHKIPMLSVELEIASVCRMLNLPDADKVFILYSRLATDCEDFVSSSQRTSIIGGCLWTCICLFNPKYCLTIKEFVVLLSELGNVSISAATVEKKHCEILKYLLSRTLKRVYSWCFRQLNVSTARSLTPRVPVTVTNCCSGDEIKLVADDGFVYPLENVDDVADWNLLFDMVYDGNGTLFQIPATVVCRPKKVSVEFRDWAVGGSAVLKAEMMQQLVG